MSSSKGLRRKSGTQKPAAKGSLVLQLLRLLTIVAAAAALLLDPHMGKDTMRLLRRLIELLVAGM